MTQFNSLSYSVLIKMRKMSASRRSRDTASYLLETTERTMYPDDAPYLFYRGGVVGAPWSRAANTAVATAAGAVASLARVHDGIVSLAGAVVLPLARRWPVPLVLFAGIATACMYHGNAVRLDRLAARCWSTQDGVHRTKTQPSRSISPELRAEAVRWGNINAFLTGVAGTALFVIHATGVWLWAYEALEARGTLYFFRDAVLSYLWIDGSAYCVHRMLHARRFYWLHKWHHRYNVPTAHAAFAAHPIDFLVFQLVGMMAFAIFRISPIAFMFVAVPTAYHNQVEHSGLKLRGEMPWTPSPQFHDDHHSQFTCNFGFEFVLWDWLGGTLRQKRGKTYGEFKFHDTW